MNIKHRQVPFHVKSIEKDGSFAGYGSVFGNADHYRDVVMPGAFAKSLSLWAEKDALPPILWQHQSSQPLGPFTKMVEDGTGLYVEGQLLIDDVQQAKEAYALIRSKTIRGMSIGYDVYDEGMTYEAKTNVWQLTALDLWEVSIATFPANVDAVITEVKSILSHGDLPSLKQFEAFLREVGVSKTKAVAIANHGLSRLLKTGKSTGDCGDCTCDAVHAVSCPCSDEYEASKSNKGGVSPALVDSVVALIENYHR